MSKKQLPKKLRGEAARLARLRTAVDAEADQRIIITKIAAVLIAERGGVARLSLAKFSAAPGIHVSVDHERSEVVVALALPPPAPPPAGSLEVGARAVVHSWSMLWSAGANQKEPPERTNLSLSGVVVFSDAASVVVRLDVPNELDLDRVAVPHEWVRAEVSGGEANSGS